MLAPHRAALIEKLWTIAEQAPPGRESQRLRAACALASYDRASWRWEKVSRALVDDLVSVDPQVLATTDGQHFRVAARLPVPVRYAGTAAAGGMIWVFGGQTAGGATDAAGSLTGASMGASAGCEGAAGSG